MGRVRMGESTRLRSGRGTGHMRGLGLGLGVLALFVAFILAGGAVLYTALLRNADSANDALSRYYASETAGNLTVYETLLDFGARSIEARVAEGNSWEELEAWADTYCTRLRTVLADEQLNVYAVIGGRVLAVGDWTADETFDVTQRDWFLHAREHPGQTTFSDVYRDAVTGANVVTVAERCEGTDAVLAFDLYPENFSFHFDMLDLPNSTSLFLCDSQGVPLYVRTSMTGHPEDEVQGYLSGLVGRIEAGEFDDGDPSKAIDLDGRERTVSYTRLDNGWYAIVTMPYRAIMGDLVWVMALFGVMALVFLAAVALMTWRDLRRSAAMERTNETVRVLGNSYYAIYLVDYEAETYEMIKGSDYVRARIPQKGAYRELLRTAGEVIEEGAFREFEESFSAASIRRLVERRVRDFGGDFLRRFGDAYRWVNVRVLYDESLSPEEAVLCFREVDREKQRQLQERRYLEEALETSQRSLDSKQAFFNNMSHDMRTPLNAIIGLTELARREPCDAERTAGYLDKIERSGRQLLALINDILDISRMEQGAVSFALEEMDLAAYLRRALEPFELQARSEGKTLSLDVDVRSGRVLGDPARLDQIVNNLLSNALKYTRTGDAVHVTLVQERAGEASEGGVASFRLTVADTGIGMSPEYLPRVFEMYAREQRFGTAQTMGTGLGMPITKSLVDQMGGDIRVESVLDEGTAFILTLPFAVPDGAAPGGEPAAAPESGDVPAAGEADGKAGASTPAAGAAAGDSRASDDAVGAAADPAPEPVAAPGAEPAAAPAPVPAPAQPDLSALAGARILVAEDNAVNMEIVGELLESVGVEVLRAWNGREAVDAFEASEPFAVDAILMDMKMPEMDGCDAARAIRALRRPDAADVPIVAVTANAFAEDIVATTVAGMDAHVSKPIDFTLLCQTVAGLLGRPRGGGDASGEEGGAR